MAVLLFGAPIGAVALSSPGSSAHVKNVELVHLCPRRNEGEVILPQIARKGG